jgi:hypothetical protein
MLTSCDQEDPVQFKTVFEMSELISSLTHFNKDKADFFKSYIS